MHSNRLIYKQQYSFHVAIKIYCVYFLARLVKMPKTSAKSTRTKAKPPIARRPRTEARSISNALLFSEELKTEFVLCDEQLLFSHWIIL